MTPKEIGDKLRSQGKHMGRQKRQRPEVYAWRGKTGEKFWKAEWRQYIEGRLKPKHRSKTWAQKDYTKTAAQHECDELVRAETHGAAQADGSMLVGDFWSKVFWPSLKLRIARNTEITYESNYRLWVQPAIGAIELQRVNKQMVDAILNKMTSAGRSQSTIDMVLAITRNLFVEAQEEGYIVRNPTRRVTIPVRAPKKKRTRSLTEDEARRIFALPVDREVLIVRLMILTGARIGEVLALTKDDLLPGGLLIDESALERTASQTKNQKQRCAPLPPKLRAELGAWAKAQSGDLIFPGVNGGMDVRNSDAMREGIKRIRESAKIPDLTPRMCRTTFATLYESDPADVQEILGHSSIDMTMENYRRPISSRQQAATDELEARLSGKVVTMKGKKRA